MVIRRYSKSDENDLFSMLSEEDDWSDYYSHSGYVKYVKALDTSITYLAYEGNVLCGFARCREDDGFGVYIYDLLVRKSFRGRQIGRMLMERVVTDYAGQPVYVISDVDKYYEKLGYEKIGSIFEVTKQEE